VYAAESGTDHQVLDEKGLVPPDEDRIGLGYVDPGSRSPGMQQIQRLPSTRERHAEQGAGRRGTDFKERWKCVRELERLTDAGGLCGQSL
jgi:hypothetical protein